MVGRICVSKSESISKSPENHRCQCHNESKYHSRHLLPWWLIDNVVVASVSETTFRTSPIFVPDTGTIRHVSGTNFLTEIFRRTPFRYVILSLIAQTPIWCGSPTNFRKTDIFPGLTRLYRVQTLFCVVCLIAAHITLQSRAWNEMKVSPVIPGYIDY